MSKKLDIIYIPAPSIAAIITEESDSYVMRTDHLYDARTCSEPAMAPDADRSKRLLEMIA